MLIAMNSSQIFCATRQSKWSSVEEQILLHNPRTSTNCHSERRLYRRQEFSFSLPVQKADSSPLANPGFGITIDYNSYLPAHASTPPFFCSHRFPPPFRLP